MILRMVNMALGTHKPPLRTRRNDENPPTPIKPFWIWFPIFVCTYIYILSHIMPSHHLGGPSWSFESCRIHLSIFEKYCSWGIKNNKKHRFLLHIFSADQLTSSSIFWEAWEAKQPSHPPTARLCPPLSVISWLINHSMYWSVLIYMYIYVYV